jgi:hypothetical protein
MPRFQQKIRERRVNALISGLTPSTGSPGTDWSSRERQEHDEIANGNPRRAEGCRQPVQPPASD